MGTTRRASRATTVDATMSGGKAEEVTWEDQQHICAFGRFNTRLHEVNAELKAKSKMVEDLEEASNELIIADAETMLQAQLDEVGAEVTALEKEKIEITSAMADLKEKLYKKFGNAINLEE